MKKILTSLIDLLLPMNDVYLYIFLFLSSIIENLFPPVPGDTITALSAFLIGIGRLDYFRVYLCTTLGSVIGFMSLFLFSKHFGRRFFYEKNYRFFTVEKIEKSEKWIKKYGYWILLFNRFLPGIRSVISVVSGISNLNSYIVLLMSFISASVWNLIWIHVGYLLGNNWDFVRERFLKLMKSYNITVIIIIIIILILYLKLRKKNI